MQTLPLDHPPKGDDNLLSSNRQAIFPLSAAIDQTPRALRYRKKSVIMKSARLALDPRLAASIFGQSSPAHQLDKSPSAAMFFSSLRETSTNASAAAANDSRRARFVADVGAKFYGPELFDAGGLGTYRSQSQISTETGKLDLVALSGCLTYDTCAPAGVAVCWATATELFKDP